MKTLILNRHAKSSWKELNIKDIERPLNKRGRINAAFMAKKFAQLNTVDLVITSPAKRAISTANEFINVLSLSEQQTIVEPMVYGAGIREMTQLISQFPNDKDTIIIFGHNPTFSDLAHLLDHSFASHMVTCARVEIQFEVNAWEEIGQDSGTVVNHIYPRMFPEMENL